MAGISVRLTCQAIRPCGYFSASRSFWNATLAASAAALESPPVMATTMGFPTMSRDSGTLITRGRS